MLKKEIRLIKNIPENWNAYVLSELGEFKNGINKDKSSFGFGVPFVNLMDVFGKSSIADNSFSLVDASEKEQELYNLKAGDILFVRSSVKPEGVGQTCVVVESLKNTVYSGFLIRFRPDSKLINWKYATHCFDGSRFRQRLLVHSTIAANTNINQESLKQLAIQLPPLPEQKAIADLLSTWDEAIEKTERLIKAKEKRFKGLIQNLISQQCDSWPHIKPKKIFDTITEKNFPEEELLSVTQDRGVIPRRMLEGRVMSPNGTTASYKLIKRGDFAISLRSFQGGIEYSNYQGIISPAYTVLRPKNKLSNDFYRLFFKSYIFIEKYLNLAVIGIRDGKQISIPDFLSIKIPVPPLEEQKEIAKTLSVCQHEIDLLKQLAEKYKIQKRGLMQKMLTGEWRVKSEIVKQYMEA